MLGSLLGFTTGTIPFLYLGCQIFKGKLKAVYFQSITDKVKSKLSTWKGTVLSINYGAYSSCQIHYPRDGSLFLSCLHVTLSSFAIA